MVTVAICTFNRHRQLAGAIDSVMYQLESYPRVSLLVIDNSADVHAAKSQRETLRARSGRIDYRITPSRGRAVARNDACQACQTPFIAFIDDDARPLPGWLDAAIKIVREAPPSTAVIGGPISLDWQNPRPVWLSDVLTGYLSAIDLGCKRRVLNETEWLFGTNIAFRVSALAQVGGFDTRLGCYRHVTMANEEMDAMRRLQSIGFNAVYEPSMSVLHCVGPERLTQDWFRRRLFWQGISDWVVANQGRDTSEQLRGGIWRDPLDVLPHELKAQITDADSFFEQCQHICFFARYSDLR